jgi:hypothetical protein
VGFQTVAPGRRCLDGCDAVFQCDIECTGCSKVSPASQRRCISVQAGRA